jgi:hypothetical protein
MPFSTWVCPTQTGSPAVTVKLDDVLTFSLPTAAGTVGATQVRVTASQATSRESRRVAGSPTGGPAAAKKGGLSLTCKMEETMEQAETRYDSPPCCALAVTAHSWCLEGLTWDGVLPRRTPVLAPWRSCGQKCRTCWKATQRSRSLPRKPP